MFGQALQKMLEAELENELGYSRYDYRNKKTDKSARTKSNEELLILISEIYQESNGDYRKESLSDIF